MDALNFIFSFPRSLPPPVQAVRTPRRCRHHRFCPTLPHASIIHPSHQETRREALEERLRSLDASCAADLAYATFSKIPLPPNWEHLLNVLSSHGITGKTLSRLASRLGIHSLISLDPNAITPIIEYITETLSVTEAQRNRIVSQRPDLLSIQMSTLTSSTDALLAYLSPCDLKQVTLRWPGVLVLPSKSIARVTAFLSSRTCLLTRDNIRCLLRRAPWVLVYDIDHDMAPVISWLQDEILPYSPDKLSKYLLASPQLLGSTRTQMSDVMHFLRDQISLNDPSSATVVRQFPPLLTCSVTDVLLPAADFLLNDVCLDKWELRKVVHGFPAVLTLDVEKDMKVVVEFFRARGISNVARLVSRLPPILGYDLETDIIPKTEYVEQALGLSLFDVLRFPAYFSYDLRNKIEPRTTFLQFIGVRIAEIGLNSALSWSDQVFCMRVGASLDSYDEFKKKGAYRRGRATLNRDYCSDAKGSALDENTHNSLDGRGGVVSKVSGSDGQHASNYRVGSAKRRKKRFRATLTRMPWEQIEEKI